MTPTATRLTFQTESFCTIYPELAPILPQYYGEVAYLRHHAAFDPDMERYRFLEAADSLLCVTARDADGPPIGLFLAVLGTHTHAKSARCAFADGLYLHPDYRQGMTATRFWHACERILKAQHVPHVILSTTLENDVSRFYARQKLTPIEVVHYKYLGED